MLCPLAVQAESHFGPISGKKGSGSQMQTTAVLQTLRFLALSEIGFRNGNP